MAPAREPDAGAASYDEIPYESEPLFESHPDAVATAATLLGIEPPSVERCRVLELGCASGGNLIPMAQSLPQGEFLGIDFSARQIAAGQALIDAVGLTNIELRSLDILDFDESFGKFDYIICHGTYSWVPASVQEKILDICARNLAAGGVAYLSYNTYPGWHARGMVRDMICFHARQFAEPQTRIQQAREFLERTVQALAKTDSAHARAVREIAEWLRPHRDSYLFHEYLEDVNQPIYFHEFVARLAAKELQYLGEPWLAAGMSSLPPEVRNTLRQLSPDPLRLEQYADFVTDRSFRRSLVGHAAAASSVTAAAKNVERTHVATLVRPVAAQPDVRSLATEVFRGEGNFAMSTSLPSLKAAFMALVDVWPAAIPFEDLWKEVGRRLAPNQAMDAGARELFATHLFECYQSRVVSLHVRPLPFSAHVSDHPTATRLARHQAQTGLTVTNLRHRTVDLTEFDRLVLGGLDGTQDQSAIMEAMIRAVHAGKLPSEPQLRSASAEQLRLMFRERIRTSLVTLAQRALLVA